MPAKLAFLHSAEASLVLECRAAGAPLWRHLGARAEPGTLGPLADSRTAASFSLDRDVPLSTAPPAGLGWFGPEALSVRRDGKICAVAFGQAEVMAHGATITVRLRDDLAGVLLEQRFALAPGGAFLCDARIENIGGTQLGVDWLASALVPLPHSSSGLISWRGRHNAELQECREAMPAQRWSAVRGAGYRAMADRRGWSCWAQEPRITPVWSTRCSSPGQETAGSRWSATTRDSGC